MTDAATARDMAQRAAATGSIGHTINFYRQGDLPWGVFSNFFVSRLTVNNVEFPTSEHYFQAMKFAHSPKDFNDAVNARTAGDTAAVGRDRSRPLRTDWEQVKDSIMFDAVTG